MTTKRTEITCSTQDEFAEKYAKLVGVLKGLTPAAIKVLAYIATNFESEDIVLDKSVKEEVAEQGGMKTQTVMLAIIDLCKEKILSKNTRYNARYRVNGGYIFGDKTKLKYVLTLVKE